MRAWLSSVPILQSNFSIGPRGGPFLTATGGVADFGGTAACFAGAEAFGGVACCADTIDVETENASIAAQQVEQMAA